MSAALCLGCSPKRRAADPAAAFGRLSQAEMQRMVDMTAWARNLKVKRQVRIERLASDVFMKKVLDVSSDDDDTTGEDESSARAMLGFSLLPPPADQSRVSKTDDILAEQVVGFYDRKVDRIFLPDVGLKTHKDEIKQRGILAHEIHHALQAQHFDIDALSKAEGDDMALAHLALIEGDAMVTMAAYFGADYGKPIHRTIRTVSDVVDDVSLEDVADRDSELANALPLTREMLLFPYDQGMLFVADIFRTGGFDLVDTLYAQPPVSTSQVLHPDKYVAGIAPAHVVLPPSDFEVLSEGRLGELRTRVMLAQCTDPNTAKSASEGWKGDAYRVGRRPDGGTVVAWLTVLDSPEQASTFESALASDEKCWKKNHVGKAFVDAGANVSRSEDRVAVVRGLPAPAAAALSQALLAAEVLSPEPSPIGDFEVPLRLPLPEHQPGRIDGDRYTSKWLGIEGRLPSGMMHRIGRQEDDLELEIKRDDRSYAALFLSDRITNERYIEAVFEDIFAALRDIIDPSRLTRPVTTSGKGPLGQGIVRTWTVIGTGVDIRAIMVPICNDTGSLVFFQIFGDDYSRQVVDGWTQSFRWLHDDAAEIPACKRLDPR